MDLSLRRVLEAYLPGPGTPRLLVQRYGMEIAESEQALAYAIEQGLVEQVGPIAYGLTVEGREVAIGLLPREQVAGATMLAGQLERRDLALRRLDV